MKVSNLIVTLIFTLILGFSHISFAIVGGHTIPTDGVYLTPQAQFNLASHLVGLVDTTDTSTHSICSAVLIAPDTALTAAHCVSRVNINNLFIVADDATFAVFARHKVQAVLVHPKYTSSLVPKTDSPNYDLALIKFEGALPAKFKPITLLETAIDRKNIWPVVAGYGYTSREKMDPGILRFTLLKVDSYIIQQNYFSADQSIGRGICKGDSGGPVLMTRGEDFVLMGITSLTARRI